MTRKIRVIGLPADGASLPEQHARLIAAADFLVGGARHLKRFGDAPGRKLPVGRDIEAVLNAIAAAREAGERVVVLATGDPLWFGIGSSLVRRFGREAVEVIPAVASPQVALARLGLPMDGAVVLSRHKKTDAPFDLLRYFPVGVILTAGGDGPDRILRELMDDLPAAAAWEGAVCQCLGTAEEAIDTGPLTRLTGKTYKTPNLLVVRNPAPLHLAAPSANFGRPDDAFAHRKGLITHPEVRAVVLSKLRLAAARVLWDVGAGSGSVGIEAALLNPALTVHAVERDPERVRQIAENRVKFGAEGLVVHAGDAAEILPALPRPDRVFIGGGGKDLPAILPPLHAALLPGGVAVAATITLESFETLSRFLRDNALTAEVVQIQVTRMTPLAGYHKMTPDNPITLFTITKKT